jgi:hypothetical protein
MTSSLGRGQDKPDAERDVPKSALRRRLQSRSFGFALLVTVSVAVAVGYVAVTAARDSTSSEQAGGGGGGASLNGAESSPGGTVLFQHVARDGDYARIAAAPVESTQASREILSLTCERVHFGGDVGLCLLPKRNVLGHEYEARVFDSDFRVLHQPSLPGINSRARVSPDGRYGATTGFVAGDSYADEGFSTRTFLLDMESGEVLANLEDFEVWRDGARISSIDFNFWGVTFARDSNRFYATLATRGETFLVEGDVEARRLTVVHENVECPSLSPDNTRIAFKKAVEGGGWRLHVLDLETKQETTLAETRSVDDQVEWLDDERVLYAISPDVWVVPADGTGAPRKFLSEALSPAVVS